VLARKIGRFHMAHDAHNGYPILPALPDALANRIFARPVLPGERLIDHRDRAGGKSVLLGEDPAGANRNPKSGEIAGSDEAEISVWAGIAWRGGLVLDLKRGGVASAERDRLTGSYDSHTREVR